MAINAEWHFQRDPLLGRDRGYFSFDLPDREAEVECSWLAIVSTISAIAFASIFSPSIATGFKWGFFSFTLSYIYAQLFFNNYQGEAPQAPPALNMHHREQPLRRRHWSFRFFVGPIVEEAIFRGFLQQSVQTAFVLIGKVSLPAAFSYANVLTAAVFGACHYKKDETAQLSFFQVSRTFMSGIIKGMAMFEGGFIAACAAHVVHNTCAETLLIR